LGEVVAPVAWGRSGVRRGCRLRGEIIGCGEEDGGAEDAQANGGAEEDEGR